ncbi:hypothetical protein C8R48DRAFT_675008 [Suillus tomentosus]|nr:hypothetical protein C8R48DRAFT_675008 [Suillus tomentosus]
MPAFATAETTLFQDPVKGTGFRARNILSLVLLLWLCLIKSYLMMDIWSYRPRQYPAGDLLPVTALSLGHIIEHFSVFTCEQYAEIARAHSIWVIPVDPKAYSAMQLGVAARHRLAKLLVDPAIHSPENPLAEDTDNDPEFPTVRKFAEKVDIIKQWQHEMSPEMQQRSACAVCAHSVCIKQLKTLYDRAILYPKGLCDRWALADLRLCRQCHAALITKRPHQPVNSLTNFQYYGHERLPSAVADAFARASAYDLMLVSRNVAIRPQDSVELCNMLPPGQDELRDAIQENMDALFEETDGDVDTSILETIDPGNITMEAIGFTKGDHSATSRDK